MGFSVGGIEADSGFEFTKRVGELVLAAVKEAHVIVGGGELRIGLDGGAKMVGGFDKFALFGKGLADADVSFGVLRIFL